MAIKTAYCCSRERIVGYDSTRTPYIHTSITLFKEKQKYRRPIDDQCTVVRTPSSIPQLCERHGNNCRCSTYSVTPHEAHVGDTSTETAMWISKFRSWKTIMRPSASILLQQYLDQPSKGPGGVQHQLQYIRCQDTGNKAESGPSIALM